VRSAKLILERLQDITGGTPSILVGDLNAGAHSMGLLGGGGEVLQGITHTTWVAS
jgi:hypothetical protein